MSIARHKLECWYSFSCEKLKSNFNLKQIHIFIDFGKYLSPSMTSAIYFYGYWLIKVIYKWHACEFDLGICKLYCLIIDDAESSRILLKNQNMTVPVKKLLLPSNCLNRVIFPSRNALEDQISLTDVVKDIPCSSLFLYDDCSINW